MMRRRRALTLAGMLVALAAVAWLLRSCYGVFVNKEDQPTVDRIVTALHAYGGAKGRHPATLDELVPEYMPALPAPRQFGSIGYAATDAGRGCLLGYFTHRDHLEEYDEDVEARRIR
jgi:hypothetical protein